MSTKTELRLSVPHINHTSANTPPVSLEKSFWLKVNSLTKDCLYLLDLKRNTEWNKTEFFMLIVSSLVVIHVYVLFDGHP